MKKLLASALVVSIAGTQLGGCENMNMDMGPTGQGAALGALTGGVLGAAVGNRNNAALGAVLGAVAGAIIANYIDKQNATRAEAARQYSYDSRSDKLEVESATLAPQAVSPGGTVNSTVRYTTLAPGTSQQVRLTETRALISGQESVDLGRREVVRQQGTHTSTAKVNVPKDLPKGNYILATTISDGKNTKTAKSAFQVV